MYAPVLLAAGLFASSANAALSILYPRGGATWYMNDTVPFNWTAPGADDPKDFRVILHNENTALLANPQQLAQQVPAANEQYRVLLGHLSPGEGYTITFVNTTNETQEFAKSEAFSIEAGTPSTSTVPPTTATQTNSSYHTPSADASTTSKANPFATTSTTATGGKNGASSNSAPAVAAAAVLAVVGVALAL